MAMPVTDISGAKMNIQTKLLHVQSKLKAPKSQYNKFGGYNYRNCEDIQEAAKPLLQEVKAILVVGDELIQISDRFYIKATAHFIDCESENEISNTAYAREEPEKKGMDASQVTGSSSSYARKYALNGLFCIDDVKDADNQNNSNNGKKTASNPKPLSDAKVSNSKKQESKQGITTTAGHEIDTEKLLEEKIDQPKLKVILGELERTGVEEMVILNLFKITKLEDVTNGQFKILMKKFTATQSKEA